MTVDVESESRFQKILLKVEEAAAGNLDVSIEVSKKNDIVDALATGINFLIAEVRGKTSELEEAADKLKQKVTELERFNKVAMGRELKMIELKNRITGLEKQLKSAGQ